MEPPWSRSEPDFVQPSNYAIGVGPCQEESRTVRPVTVRLRGRSVNGPHTRRSDLEQVTVGVAEVEAHAAALPAFPFFDGDAVLRQPRFPAGQLFRIDGECQVQFAVSIVRRFRGARPALEEEKQD